MHEKLVSIIIPCYNVESKIYKMLVSLCNQSYSNLELIFVNDGSLDATVEKIKDFENIFKEKGYTFKIINQVNMGLPAALNSGFRIMTGDYFCWPDADDYFEPDSILKRVEVLDQFADIDVVTSDAYVRENTTNDILNLASVGQVNIHSDNQFLELLTGNSMFIPGTHMVRTNIFFKYQPKDLILEGVRGQNWQILLPLYFNCKRKFIDEPLYNYILYDDSMSKDRDTFNDNITRSREHEFIIIETLKNIKMSNSEMSKYLQLVKVLYSKKNLTICFKYNNKKYKEFYDYLLLQNSLSLKDRFYYLILKYTNLSIYIFNFKEKIIK